MSRSSLVTLIFLAALIVGCNRESAPVDTPSSVVTSSPAATPVGVETPVINETATATPLPSADPGATATPTPTPTPTGPSEENVAKARELLEKAEGLAMGKSYDEAIPLLEEAEKLNPGEPDVYFWLFACHKRTEVEPSRKSPAYRYAEKIVKLDHRATRIRQAKKYLENVASMPEAPSAPPKDVRGWEGAKWGMNEKQLKAAFPGQLTVDRKSEHGLYIVYRLREARLMANERMKVSFTVGTSGLKSVDIVPERKKRLRGKNVELFHKLEKVLAARYGSNQRSAGEDRFHQGQLVNATRVWDFPTSIVQITGTGGPPWIHIKPKRKKKR